MFQCLINFPLQIPCPSLCLSISSLGQPLLPSVAVTGPACNSPLLLTAFCRTMEFSAVCLVLYLTSGTCKSPCVLINE